MGHLPIVNAQSLLELRKSGVIRVRARLGNDDSTRNGLIHQLADMCADLLSTRRGDSVFPWKTGEKGGPSFSMRCTISGSPVFVPGSDAPFLVPLEEDATSFAGCDEATALDLTGSRLLWNAIGKKSLGRGRGITHQVPWEDSQLNALLTASGGESACTLGSSDLRNATPLTIDCSKEINAEYETALCSLPTEERMSALDLSQIGWVDAKSGRFRHEKALEAWLVENIDQQNAHELRELLLEEGERICWSGNYLTYGVAGASIDWVLEARTPSGDTRIIVVELKVGTCSSQVFAASLGQAKRYAEFIGRIYIKAGNQASVRYLVLSATPKRKRKGGPSREHVGYAVAPDGQLSFSLLPA